MSDSTVPPFRPALLVVDVQEDFCPPDGALAVPDGRAVIPVINALLALPFAFKVATKDHHPPGHVSFASSHGGDAQPYVSHTTIANPANPAETYTSRLWPDHCVAGTPGNALARELDTRSIQRVVLKGQDPRVEMYSAFRSPLRDPPLPSAVSELADLLKEQEITDVFVTGLAGDYCVFHSAVDSAEGGWRTYVVEEAVRSVGGEEAWKGVNKDFESKGIRVVQVDGEEVARVRQLGA
ncbi:pyrazinamidase/nicotinamidase [Wolfiporia cocos MD-104 SS10]|uniref:nicotinamidase n=1 Tax=Wolfiporia cocos (strain MD-104) TaxID=742152 RepID=A0A2H3JSU1_WOLCO|nr:pyrazinamidase/nicotinamidase [Wolfiporia cocos MD-104 SS10]